MKTLALALPFLALATPAFATDVWQDQSGNLGTYWQAAENGRMIQIHCNGKALMAIIFGGDTPLPKAVQLENGEAEMLAVLEPSGTSREFTGEWLGAMDNALTTQFPSDAAFLDDFQSAKSMQIRAVDGSIIYESGMSGAMNARFGFGEVCGL